MNLNLFLAKRYFIFKKSSHIINIISWISIFSIAICTAAFIIVLSVFNGIDGLIKSLYNSYSGDIKITPSYGKTIMLTDQEILYLKNKSLFSNTSFIVSLDAVIQLQNSQFVIKLEGVDSNFKKKQFLSSYLKQGKYFSSSSSNHDIILGQPIAASLGIDVDINPMDITIYTTPIKIQSNNLESELVASSFYPIGEYSIHKDIDIKYCFAPLETVKKLSGLENNEFTSIQLNLIDNSQQNLLKIQQELQKFFATKKVIVEDKYQQNKSLFAILKTEKISIIFILAFIIFISSFNIAGTINLLIMEKIKQIYLLRSFGLSSPNIRQIFIYCGIFLGLSGVFIGFIIGTSICALQYFFHLVPIQGAFIINYFPVKIQLEDYLITALIVIVITYMSTQFAIIRLKKNLSKKVILN